MAGTILIVDDVATNRILLKVRLAAACYRTTQAATGGAAVAEARRCLPDLILLDYCLPDMDGVGVLHALRGDPATAAIPVIFVTARTDPEARCAALRAGADGFLVKPVEDRLLLARIRSLLRERGEEDGLRAQAAALHDAGFREPGAAFVPAAQIGLIAARPDTALRWRAALSGQMRDRLIPMTREEALANASADAGPDAYMIAAHLGARESGLTLMSDLRSRPRSRDAAICVVMPDPEGEVAAMALDLGAADVVPEAFDPEETALRLGVLLRRKRAADRERAALQRGLSLATTDPLTGLHNRRYALPAFGRMLEAGRARGAQTAVMVIDIDRFKAVNDRFGHATGDIVLVEVARRLRALLPPEGVLARIGGEEFLAAVPEATEAGARALAERLCDAIAARPVTAAGGGQGEGVTFRLSVSIGLALDAPGTRAGAGAGEAPDAVIARADLALLVAKSEGRNQVTMGRTAA